MIGPRVSDYHSRRRLATLTIKKELLRILVESKSSTIILFCLPFPVYEVGITRFNFTLFSKPINFIEFHSEKRTWMMAKYIFIDRISSGILQRQKINDVPLLKNRYKIKFCNNKRGVHGLVCLSRYNCTIAMTTQLFFNSRSAANELCQREPVFVITSLHWGWQF
jgi:hypothetical protein